MKRQHPLFSLLSIALLVAMLGLLGVTIRVSGLTLFSPGRLSAKTLPDQLMNGYSNHAAFEGQCNLCHQPLQTTQDVLCLRCHAPTRQEIDTQAGLHARIPGVEKCAACHSDHRGTSFDPGLAALSSFDHSIADFSLMQHQVNYNLSPLECQACHDLAGAFDTPAGKCSACHAAHDLDFMAGHILDFGENCAGCHDGLDSLVPFDHASTDFPLRGAHVPLDCAACHGKHPASFISGDPGRDLSLASFGETPRACKSCHSEPPIHQGVFSKQKCVDCHNQQSWSPARLEGQEFEHFSSSGFSLERHAVDYSGTAMDCLDCHSDATFQNFDPGVCTTCHSGQDGGPPDDQKARFMQKHAAQFGTACLDCHDGVDRLQDFDHDRVFPLDGRHAGIECQDCHADKVFRGTPGECIACHAEPEIHAGFFGLECQLCHTSQAWTPAALSQHDFPLDHGGQGESTCETCHTDNVYVEYTCYGCHEHKPEKIEPEHLEEGISLEELAACAGCHPSGEEAEGDD